MDGPAKGFLNKVCICNPPMAKPAPANKAVMVCGKRVFITIEVQADLEASPPRITSYNVCYTKLLRDYKLNGTRIKAYNLKTFTGVKHLTGQNRTVPNEVPGGTTQAYSIVYLGASGRITSYNVCYTKLLRAGY